MVKRPKMYKAVSESELSDRGYYNVHPGCHLWIHLKLVAYAWVRRESLHSHGSCIHYETRKRFVEQLEDEIIANGKTKLPQRKLKKLIQWQYVLGYRFRAIQVVNEHTILSW